MPLLAKEEWAERAASHVASDKNVINQAVAFRMNGKTLLLKFKVMILETKFLNGEPKIF